VLYIYIYILMARKEKEEFTALSLGFHFRHLRTIVMDRTWVIKMWVMLMSTSTSVLLITMKIWIMINRRIIRLRRTELKNDEHLLFFFT